MKTCQMCGGETWAQTERERRDRLWHCAQCRAAAKEEFIQYDDDVPLIGLKIDGEQVRSIKDVFLALLARSESMSETRFERIVIGLLRSPNYTLRGASNDVALAKDVCGLAFCIDREMAKKDYEPASKPPRISV